ncbi:dTMP kinase [Gordonia neofelifaecis]|uniref:Thymidylate kinase n=1 Tax=Gordonia neofelifaecis NRRL B-59395 TaxID=644548 RepID=F1YJG5_9ACTN|nr:dTMP kinase [Gordonia neofelifaecis]EGD55198.1 thymidylate kinase [Gordonia neofelifaecis NRRL B-59395]
MGILVAVEGLDGAGKRTIVGRIEAAATDRGASVSTLAFPRYGESITADLASEALHGRHGDLRESVYAMALLFALDRAAARRQLREALTAHDLVICDRYCASNAAYSAARLGGGADSEVVEWVADLEFGRFQLPVPDHQLLLGVPPDVAMSRANGRAETDADRPVDSYERDAELQHAVYRVYGEFVESHWMSSWSWADGDDAVAAVLAQL